MTKMLIISDWTVLFRKCKKNGVENSGKVLKPTCNTKSELRRNSVLRGGMKLVGAPKKPNELG